MPIADTDQPHVLVKDNSLVDVGMAKPDSNSNNHLEMDGPTHRLAHWATTLPRERTVEVQSEAVDGFKDLMICMIGGSAEPTARTAANAAAQTGTGPCTIIGDAAGRKTSAAWAAFANGAAAHILDFDDSFGPLQGHVSVTIIPALLALAEEQHASGSDLLDAFVVGVEAAAIIGRANTTTYNVGWHNTAVIGVVATAVACARLLRLNTRQVVSAIGVAVSSSSGNMSQNGYDVKSLQPAFAARDGLFAAVLARSGIVGGPETLAGPMGFSSLYSPMGEGAAERYVIPRHDQPLSIVDPGIIYKPYACCGDMHRAIDAAFNLVIDHDIQSQDVQAVDIALPFNSVRNLPYVRPTNSAQARFCVPYNLALVFFNRQITLSDYDDVSLNRQNILDFIPKVTLRVIPDSENSPHTTYLDFPNEVTVILHSGKVYRQSQMVRKGDRKNPMSPKDWKGKIDGCLRRTLSPERAAAVLRCIEGSADLNDVGELTVLLRGIA
ncbi:hypothetical protein BCR39DRAFT_163896 [Naematelia encephala]|uniref:MmgE/PrpD family protein n=1 Tax=Naematelia encephala TaxID=71784 RepID=A0A1Y2B539_9TREE|nr:hypothetical protein BCR39DRAFT_163896 [Naematelia encephala]